MGATKKNQVVVRSVFPYYGGKSSMAQFIVSLMPAHRVYIEPFFGSGAVLFAKPQVRHEIVNDLDNVIATFWRMLRDRPADLEHVCALSPHSRVEFHDANPDEPDLDELEIARRFWVRVNQSFAKTGSRASAWSVTTARTQSIPAGVMVRLGRFAAVAARLSNATIESCDAASLVSRLATADTVVYCDPPYLATTRTSRTGNAGDYRVDGGNVADHERLAEILTATPASVILSGYPSDAYASLYKGWVTIDQATMVHSSNSTNSTRSGRTERLWLNFDPAGRLAFDDCNPHGLDTVAGG